MSVAMGAEGLQCAVCLHVQFAAAEHDKPIIGRIREAVTMYDGTALCRLHMEDYDRATGGGLLAIACRIIGVRRPRRGLRP